MPLEPLAHRNLQDTALAYKTYVSPTDDANYFALGSQNLRTSNKSYFERRPGFCDQLEATPTTFNKAQRIFGWNRWDGTFIVMVSNLNAAGVQEVWKFAIGSDGSFVKLFTSAGAAPFDFVVSNNTVYFGNGTENRKWNPADGLSNWGIAAPLAALVLSTDGFYAGAAAGTNWTTPGNATGKPDQKYAVYNATTQDYLKLTAFSAAVPAGAAITGVIVSITGHATSTTTAQRQINVALTKDGSTVAGSAKTAQTLNLATDAVLQLGGAGDLWGNASLAASDVEASTFGVLIQDADTTAAELDIDSVNVVIYWTATNGITAQVGWVYQACYGNSKTGHFSSPSDNSNLTGIVAGGSVGVALVASPDAQVDKIYLFRDLDGGGGNFFDTAASPYSNATAKVYDLTPDTGLDPVTIAPLPTYNDPPPLWQGVTYWNGRVWGFVDNKLWFSGLEEITTGVPEESVPSGVAGNFFQFDEAITAVSSTPNALIVFCGGRVYAMQGDTLDTFRRTLLSNRRGCRNRAAVAAFGGMVAWLDSSGQVWGTDGQSLKEIGQDIRPDTEAIVAVNASMAFHAAGEHHWLVLSTGTELLVYDLDTDQWMPPWMVATTAIASVETSPGVFNLVAPINGVLYKLGTQRNDAGAPYGWNATVSPFNIIPDFGRKFSWIATGSYDMPTMLGTPWGVGLEMTPNDVNSVQLCVDDDGSNAGATWVDVTNNEADIETALLRRQGSFLLQRIWPLGQESARRVWLKVVGQVLDQDDKVYTMFIAYRQSGGRGTQGAAK